MTRVSRSDPVSTLDQVQSWTMEAEKRTLAGRIWWGGSGFSLSNYSWCTVDVVKNIDTQSAQLASSKVKWKETGKFNPEIVKSNHSALQRPQV